MKILCVIDSLGSGGAQRQLVNLAIGFKEKGHEVSFLVYHRENFFKYLLDEAKIPIVELIGLNYLNRLLKIRRYIKDGNFNVVLSFLGSANFICEIAGLPYRNWRLIVGERSANPKVSTSLKLIIYCWFHFLADFVVANSEANIEIIRKVNPLLPKRKCKVIYNIVDLAKWKSKMDYVPLVNGKLKLVVAASLIYLKNLNGLIEAVYLMSEDEKSRLVIEWYGKEYDTSLQEGMKKININNLSSVFNFYPATPDITQMMQQADVVGLFSFYEGLPNTVCEGMVLGKTIISSSVSDVPLLLNQSINCTFNPYQAMDISKALSYVLSLSQKELLEIGEKNKNKGLALFDKNKIVLGYINLFN